MPSSETLKLFGQDIVDQIRLEAESLGVALATDLQGVAEYAATRADHLSLAIGEPGFDLALKAERDSLALKAAVAGVQRADQVDARILAVAQGGLALAARGIRLLAGVPPVVT